MQYPYRRVAWRETVDQTERRVTASTVHSERALECPPMLVNPGCWGQSCGMDTGPADGSQTRQCQSSQRVCVTGFDVIVASGKMEVAVQITGDGVHAPAKISDTKRLSTSIADRVLRLTTAPAANENPEAPTPTISVEVGLLDRVSAVGGATIVLTGLLDHLHIVALDGGNINATALRLRTAAVELEQSTVSICATNSVTGYVVYGSRLTVSGGGDISGVTTANAGKLFEDNAR